MNDIAGPDVRSDSADRDIVEVDVQPGEIDPALLHQPDIAGLDVIATPRPAAPTPAEEPAQDDNAFGQIVAEAPVEPVPVDVPQHGDAAVLRHDSHALDSHIAEVDGSSPGIDAILPHQPDPADPDVIATAAPAVPTSVEEPVALDVADFHHIVAETPPEPVPVDLPQHSDALALWDDPHALAVPPPPDPLPQQLEQFQVPSPEAPASGDRRTGVLGWFVKHPWFALFVILPVTLATLYYGFVASDVYVSQSRFVIKSPNQRQAQTSTLASLIQTTGLSSGQEQTNQVLDYLRSRNALADLAKRVDIRAMYTLPGIDLLSRYPLPWKADRFENLYRYYGNNVDARLDNDTGLAVLDVRAFTPEDARAINEQLLSMSEGVVNRLNERSRQKAISEGEKRVIDAEGRVRRARSALGGFRNSTALIDPTKQASGVLAISDKLISEQAALQAQLDLMLRAAPRNPGIPALRGQIASIGREIALQNSRAVGGTGAIASRLGGYENLALEQEFAAQMLTAANASLEQSRNEAEKQQFYLERVVEPNTPDLALYPKRIKQILTIAAAALCLYLIGWMLVVGILEHAPED